MTTWDRQDKPLAKEFKKFSQIVGRLDLIDISPAPGDVAIVIPDEWAKPYGDFSRFGLTGPAAIPYVSTANGDAVPGQPQPNASSANQWLMSSALTSFILARRAGLRADFPREYSDWASRRMLFMPSPLTSTGDGFLAHVHSDFYEKAKNTSNPAAFYMRPLRQTAPYPR